MILRAKLPKKRVLRRPASLRVECLEPRRLLTVAGPTVVDVSVSSTSWASGYVDYLASHNFGNGGYSIPVGNNSQTLTLPWTNIDKIRITFSEDVKVEASDMALTGTNVSQFHFSGFGYDAQSHVATWTLSQTLGADKALIELNADGLDPIVSQSAGHVLDGEWTTNSTTFPSGNGNEGGNFAFRFNVLPGDVNQSGLVTVADYARIYAVRNTNTSSSLYDPIRDIDGSGNINATDYNYPLAHLNATLPSGNPAGTSNHAPTTQGFANVVVDEDASDQVLSLWDAFQDAESTDSQLTYQVVSNSNSSLVSGATIDADHGQLTLSLAHDANGTADLIIRATDAGGLSVDTPLHVQVNAVNDAPVISNFHATGGPIDIWTLTGTVADVDDNPAGRIVYFYGVLEGHSATIQEDGSFQLVVELGLYTWGTTWVQTADIHGALSNTPSEFVGVT